MQFKMVDDKPIMDQVHEYENLVADILSEGMKMCEILQANFLIEKLPDSWAGYHNHLKHKKKDLTLEELVGHMKIEEANRLKDKPKPKSADTVKANLVESSVKSDRSKQGNKPGGSKPNMKPRKGQKFKKSGNQPDKQQQQKQGGTGIGCYVCGKPGHKAWQCRNRADIQN